MESLTEHNARYEAVLRDVFGQLSTAWQVEQREADLVRWTVVQPRSAELPPQGWKLHVSAAHTEAIEFANTVLPFLIRARASFKIASNLESYLTINSGRAGPTQIGKILTIYGSVTSDLGTLTARVARLWGDTTGPSVPSDLKVIGSNSLFLRYGVIAASKTMVDRLGRHAFVLRRPDGVDVPDERNIDGSQPSWAPPPPIPCLSPTQINIDSRFEIAGEEYIPIVLLNGSPRGKTYLGISLEDGRSVILKTATRGFAWSIDGHDAVYLLKREYDVLSDVTRSTDVGPRPLGFDSANGGVLAMEDLQGESLEDETPASVIGLLPLMADAVSRLHSSGYVHGDIKLSNMIAVDGAVRLVDFGLARAIGHKGVSGGTRNYIPPEGTDAPAVPAGDVFSLGVSIAHALLGVNPATLPAPTSRVLSLLDLLGEVDAVKLLRPVMHRDPRRRPTAHSVAESLRTILPQLEASTTGTTQVGSRQRRSDPGRRWCIRAAASAAMATRTFLEVDKSSATGWWRNGHFESAYSCEGINLGAAGIILGLIGIDHALRRNDFERDVSLGCTWLARRPPATEAKGFLSGDAGVAVALIVAGHRYDRVDWILAGQTRLENASEVRQDYDLFSGTAGVLVAACVIGRILNQEWPREIGRDLADELVRTARLEKGVRIWPAFNGIDSPLTGAAHGSAGIAFAMAEWSKLTGDDQARRLAIDVLSRLFDQGRLPSGALMRSFEEPPTPTDDRFWCHGAAGYLWSVLVGLGDEPVLREAIDWGADRFFASAILTSPVYCHGLAGQLDLCTVLSGIDRYRPRAEERAALIAGALRFLMDRREGSVVWMSEEPDTITPDLWIGFLGPAVAVAAHGLASTQSFVSPEWLATCSKPI